MGNPIENFVAGKLFGGIIGSTQKNKSSKTRSANNENIKFEANDSYGDKYIVNLKKKEAKVNSKWNQFMQRFGLGEELTYEEQKILNNENRKERTRQMTRFDDDPWN